MSTRPRPHRGFTLIEAILFIVIVGVAVFGILGAIGVINIRSAEPVQRKQAQLIAEALLEEVRLARMTYCDPNSPNYDSATSTANCATVGATAEVWGQEGASGRPYDNVNDYVTQAGVAQPAFNNGSGKLVDANGSEIGAGAYTATLKITPVALGDIVVSNAALADNDALAIEVTVSYTGGSVTLAGYRTRYAPQN